MNKAFATEIILTFGILIASGILLLELKGVFYGQTKLSQEEIASAFADDIENIVDKTIAVTGNATFVYYPAIRSYTLTVKNNTVLIYDKSSKNTASFTKTDINLQDMFFENSEIIYIIKFVDSVYILGKCRGMNESCSYSIMCCPDNPYCWGSSFVCHKNCADLGINAADNQACCSGFLNKTTGKCDEPPFCPVNRICTGAPESAKIGGEDCCPTNEPICTNGHCCPADKPIWCEKPKAGHGSKRCMDQNEYNNECIVCPSDSPCTDGWPAHQGDIRIYNENVNACDVFEVCHENLKQIAEESINCCDNGCPGGCHNRCTQAMIDSGANINPNQNNLKKCYAFYLAWGLSSEAKFMRGYWEAEINCQNSGVCQPKVGFNSNAQSLVCRSCVGNPCGWISDTDMSQNSCMMSDLPAHVDTNILNTGICMDYSITLTTLLRIVGYSKDEIYTQIGADGPFRGHAWNLVKLPGETKWLLMDSVGNRAPPYRLGLTPYNLYDYCNALGVDNGVSLGSNGCTNDAQKIVCPSRSETYGC